MGFPYNTISIMNHSPLKALQNYIFSNLVRLTNDYHDPNIDTTTSSELHPSPSLVSLPIHLTGKTIENHLPIVQYTMLKSRLGANVEEDDVDSSCVVCLSSIEAWHKVRELGNCDHVFHFECLDSWIDQGRETCPVCRARLWAGYGDEMNGAKDPWRSERMIYLFGEDCVLSKLN